MCLQSVHNLRKKFVKNCDWKSVQYENMHNVKIYIIIIHIVKFVVEDLHEVAN